MGSDYVFEEASGLLEKLLGVDVSAKQKQKVSEHFGQLLEVEARQMEVASSLEVSQDVYTYLQCDGSYAKTCNIISNMSFLLSSIFANKQF